MTITQRKRTIPEEIQIVNEPGLQIECDCCMSDLTHSIRMKCADSACEVEDGIDICPACFCAGKEFKTHRRWHAYRVVELHSYPIFAEDWGADEELLLIEGTGLQGLGNWQAVAEHVGTRTKEEVEEHYNNVYINSPHWPLPRMDLSFDVDPAQFHERKRRRIENMNHVAPAPKPAPTSAPGVHEIQTFLPGRLEFEHELDSDAEDLVKDMEFGVVLEYEGGQMPVDENDVDVLARAKLEEERRKGREMSVDGMESVDLTNGSDGLNGGSIKVVKEESQEGGDADPNAEEQVLPPPYETRDSVEFKLTLLETYLQRVDRRIEAKALMFDRGLLEYRKMQALDKKRTKEEKDIAHRLRPLAKLQTAEDYEAFVDGIIYESVLRKRIQELQQLRRMGLKTAEDIERYEQDCIKRASAKAVLASSYNDRIQLRVGGGRGSMGADARRSSVMSMDDDRHDHPNRPTAPGSSSLFKKQPAPLNLAERDGLHLLTPAEQTLCSSLRIMPKPYLLLKETLIREYARRGGNLRRREARELIKIDVNKTSKLWDFLQQAGFLKAALENGPPNHKPNLNGSTPLHLHSHTLSSATLPLSRTSSHSNYPDTSVDSSPSKEQGIAQPQPMPLLSAGPASSSWNL